MWMVTSVERFRCSTYRATKLRALSRTESLTDRLNKRYERHGMTQRRYRTQKVAGSSPASSSERRLRFPTKCDGSRPIVEFFVPLQAAV